MRLSKDNTEPPFPRSYFIAQRLFQIALWITIGATCLAISFHFIVIANAFLFNEDIWYRNLFTLTNFWRTSQVVHFNITQNFVIALTNALLPLWGFFSHFQMMALNLAFLALLFRWLGVLGLSLWLRWLGVGLFMTMPTITEGTVWIIGSHTFFSLIWFLAALNVLPQQGGSQHWGRWTLSGVFLLLMLTSSPVTYVSFFLIGAYLFIAYPSFKLRSLWMVFFCLGAFYIYYRNLIVTGDGFTFSDSYSKAMTGEPAIFIFKTLVDMAEGSNPLVMLLRYDSLGRAVPSMHNLTHLLHWFWILGIWAAALVKLPRIAWPLALFGFGALASLVQTGPYIGIRYFLPLLFVQIVGMLLFLQLVSHRLQIFRRAALASFGALVILINLSAKMNADWHNWIIPKHVEQATLALASEHSQEQTLLFLNYRPPFPPLYPETAHAQFGGMRKVLTYANIPVCIYRGYRDGASEEEILDARFQNSEELLRFNHLTPKTYPCPIIPSVSQKPKCYEYDYSRFPFGAYRRISGRVRVAGSLQSDERPALKTQVEMQAVCL